jgi:hypothetical protein
MSVAVELAQPQGGSESPYSAQALLGATAALLQPRSPPPVPSRFKDSSPVTTPTASHEVVFAPSSVIARYPADPGHKRLVGSIAQSHALIFDFMAGQWLSGARS